MNKRIYFVAISILFVIMQTACTNVEDDMQTACTNVEGDNDRPQYDTDIFLDEYGDTLNYDMRIVTDVWAREVFIPSKIETIVTLGPGATRLATYLGVVDMIIGAETQTSNFNILMDFSPVVYPIFEKKPIVGRGGGSGENNAYVEALIKLDPDVILAAFTPEAANSLQEQTNIPVVAVRYTSTGLANETFFNGLNVFAQVVNKESRAIEIENFVESLRRDLSERTINIALNNRPTVYAGAITFAGQRGFGGTYSNFGPLVAINALNVADTVFEEGFYEVSFEQILLWDPDIIFIDPGNIALINGEYASNPNFFNSLTAIQNGRVYTLPSFNFSAQNISYGFINAYFAGTILYPDQFEDIFIEDIADKVLTFFLGINTFEIMKQNGLFFGNINIGLPNL